MAEIDGDLWKYNFARVIVLDVSDDYRLMQDPLPACCYPVLAEMLWPSYALQGNIHDQRLVEGYLYDWHASDSETNSTYIGVVSQELAKSLGEAV